MNQYQDEQIHCAECGTAFLFSAAEAAFYAEKNLASPPRRCKECRAARKDRSRQPRRPQGNAPFAGGYSDRGHRPMPAASRDGRRMDPRNRPAPRYTGDVNEYRSPMQDSAYIAPPAWNRRDRPQRPPTEDGIYRSPAFGNERRPRAEARADAPAPRQPKAPRPPTPMFDITCNTCGNQAQVPFKPIEGRDVFCQGCYRARKPVRATQEQG